MFSKLTLGAALSAILACSAQAQTVGNEVQRDVNQQQRIESGLDSGQLSSGEAARLEAGQTHVDRLEQNANRDGNLSPAEAQRIEHAQNVQNRRIYDLKHNGIAGNPNSPSSKRLQNDVQRNVNQQQRIEQGVQSGSVTNREAGRLEGGQARVNRREAVAGANGHVGPREQGRIQSAENRQSHRIYRVKHNAKTG